jgi:hypothetical protein
MQGQQHPRLAISTGTVECYEEWWRSGEVAKEVSAEQQARLGSFG